MLDHGCMERLMRETIEESKKSKLENQGIHPKVGAILSDEQGNILQRAHRGEEPGCHAEFLCLRKAEQAGQNIKECLFFVTMEPCTARGPGKKSCSERIIESGIKKVYIGILDPNPAICGRGETRLRFFVDVDRFPSDLVKRIQEINEDFIELYRKAHLSQDSLYVKKQIHHIVHDFLLRQGIPLAYELPVGIDLVTVSKSVV